MVRDVHGGTNASKVDQISIYDGGLDAGLDPLVGHGLDAAPTRQGCVFTRVADQLITSDKFDRVIPVAIGGRPSRNGTQAAAGSLSRFTV